MLVYVRTAVLGGNMRTSLTPANKILLQAGASMLTISAKNMEQFNEALLNYYNTAENCLQTY